MLDETFALFLHRNALAICTIIICGVGLAGSLIEQLQGSADNDQVGGVETTTESGQMFELSSESEANTTAPMELVRFTLDEFPKRESRVLKNFVSFLFVFMSHMNR